MEGSSLGAGLMRDHARRALLEPLQAGIHLAAQPLTPQATTGEDELILPVRVPLEDEKLVVVDPVALIFVEASGLKVAVAVADQLTVALVGAMRSSSWSIWNRLIFTTVWVFIVISSAVRFQELCHGQDATRGTH